MAEPGGQPAGPNMGQLESMRQAQGHGGDEESGMMKALLWLNLEKAGILDKISFEAAVSGIQLEAIGGVLKGAMPGIGGMEHLFKGIEFIDTPESGLVGVGGQGHDGAGHHESPQAGGAHPHEAGHHGHEGVSHPHQAGHHGHEGVSHPHQAGHHGGHEGGHHGGHQGGHQGGGHHGGGADHSHERGESNLRNTVDGTSNPNPINYNLEDSFDNNWDTGRTSAEQNRKLSDTISKYKKMGAGDANGDSDGGESGGSNRSDHAPAFGEQFPDLPPGTHPGGVDPAIALSPEATPSQGKGRGQGRGGGRGAGG